MIITFCGHADFRPTYNYEQQMLAFLEEKVGDEPAEMFLGGYGSFDNFAYRCCKQYKMSHPRISLVFVTPYLSFEYLDRRLGSEKARYDSVLYPEIENKPMKFAITYRNRYMVEKADYVVAYVAHKRGGAYAAYQHAKRKGKEIFNLADAVQHI